MRDVIICYWCERERERATRPYREENTYCEECETFVDRLGRDMAPLLRKMMPVSMRLETLAEFNKHLKPRKKKTGAIMITPDALNHLDEWISISPDYQKILGYGKTVTEASEMAEKSKLGFGLLMFMPKDWDRPHIHY